MKKIIYAVMLLLCLSLGTYLIITQVPTQKRTDLDQKVSEENDQDLRDEKIAEQKRIEEQLLAEQKRIEEQQEAIAFLEEFYYDEDWSDAKLERYLGPKVLKALSEEDFGEEYNTFMLFGLDPAGDLDLLEVKGPVATDDGRYEMVFNTAYWGDHGSIISTRLIYTVEKNNGAFCITDIEWR